MKNLDNCGLQKETIKLIKSLSKDQKAFAIELLVNLLHNKKTQVDRLTALINKPKGI